MRKAGLLLLVLFFSPMLQADAGYVDLVYRDSLSSLPAERAWFKQLFSDEERKVYLVVSVTRQNGGDGQEILIVPPKIMESFERTEDSFKRIKSENLNLLASQFVNNVEQLVLKVEFFSVKKQQANAFVEGLKSLASAYIAAGATPVASRVATSAMDAIQSVILDNRQLYLTYRGGLKLDQLESQLNLYFDNSGNINDRIFDGVDADAVSRVVFQLKVRPNFIVDYQYSFLNQGVNLFEKAAFNKLAQAKTSSEKLEACSELRHKLKLRFSTDTVDDLVAIAINDIEWPQDETGFRCIGADEAVKYKRQHGLKKIANCTSDECSKTKAILILLEADPSSEVIGRIAGSTDYARSCNDSTQFTRLYRWSNIRSVPVNESFRSFSVKSCLQTNEGNLSYDHKFSWLEGKLVSHACVLSVVSNNCN